MEVEAVSKVEVSVEVYVAVGGVVEAVVVPLSVLR